jgi:hypothetical protein
MKRDVVPVGDMPNYPLLAGIVKEAHNRYLGFGVSPSKLAEIKYFINNEVHRLVETGEWHTRCIMEDGRRAEFKRIEVLQDVSPSDLKVIPVWEYMD